MIIRLSLPDFLQNKEQFKMDKKLHECIHHAIDHFYHTIKEHPESLHDDLKDRNLQKAKYFLYGSSFGGGQSIRHAQLYPQTFDGYISHDGSLLDTKDIPKINQRTFDYPVDRCPYYHIDDIKDLVLIFQNRDDNNVNISGALEFLIIN